MDDGNYPNRRLENNHFFFLITENGRALGYIWIEIRDYQENAFLRAYQSLFVHHISIAIDHQNKGLGKQFMNKVMEFALERNIKRIELDYWSDNENAKSFYEKMGFTPYREFVFKELD